MATAEAIFGCILLAVLCLAMILAGIALVVVFIWAIKSLVADWRDCDG